MGVHSLLSHVLQIATYSDALLCQGDERSNIVSLGRSLPLFPLKCPIAKIYCNFPIFMMFKKFLHILLRT